MADFADLGSDITEVSTDAAINAVRAKAAKVLTPTGTCHNRRCEDDTDKVFCSPECRDEYDRLQRRLQ